MCSVLDKHTSYDKQKHQLTTESVKYGSVMFYSTGPRVKVAGSDKHACLPRYSINYSCKCFI